MTMPISMMANRFLSIPVADLGVERRFFWLDFVGLPNVVISIFLRAALLAHWIIAHIIGCCSARTAFGKCPW